MSQLPAGLVDMNVEIFKFQNIIYAIYNGKIILFIQLHEDIKNEFRNDLYSFPIAIKTMAEMNIVTDEEMLLMWVGCNYSSFNNEPDFNCITKTTNKEYVDCPERGKCKGEGKICQALKVINGILTRREIEVLKLIAEGLLNKEIAERTNISVTTVPVHIQHISQKTKLGTRTEMAAFAYKKGIV